MTLQAKEESMQPRFYVLLVTTLQTCKPCPKNLGTLVHDSNSIKILFFYYLLRGETPLTPLLKLHNSIEIIFFCYFFQEGNSFVNAMQ